MSCDCELYVNRVYRGVLKVLNLRQDGIHVRQTKRPSNRSIGFGCLILTCQNNSILQSAFRLVCFSPSPSSVSPPRLDTWCRRGGLFSPSPDLPRGALSLSHFLPSDLACTRPPSATERVPSSKLDPTRGYCIGSGIWMVLRAHVDERFLSTPLPSRGLSLSFFADGVRVAPLAFYLGVESERVSVRG